MGELNTRTMVINAGIRTPKQVIELACPEKADEIEKILIKAIQSVSDEESMVIIMVENEELSWGTFTIG